MGDEEGQEITDVMIGITHIQNILAYTLFDIVSSISFISTLFAREHKLPLETYKNKIIIETPTDNTATDKLIKNSCLTMVDKTFEIKFFALIMPE